MTSDKDLIKERFEARFLTYDRLAHVQRRICMRLSDLVAEYCRADVHRAMEIGAGTGFLTRRLVERWPGARWYINDLVPAAEGFLAPHVAGVDARYLWGDAETMEFPGGLDLIASASTVQWFADQCAFAVKVRASLNRGGCLALAAFGPDNFREIRGAAGEGLDYPSLDEAAHVLCESGFKVLHREQYTETMTFAAPLDVLRYIRAIGVNSVRRTSWNHGRLARFESRYRQMYPAPGGGVTLTYHPTLLVAESI